MANSILGLIKTIKSAGLYGGSFKPPEPLPNSIAAKQIEQQELAEEAANRPENQLQQTQKAQQDAVSELQKAQQQIQQLQGELQNSQATTQQQQQAVEAQAQQAIQKAQMDAAYELQAEKIKNQKELLSMQHKHMVGMQKAPKDQGGILANQLKRVVSRVSKMAAIQIEDRHPAAVTPVSTTLAVNKKIPANKPIKDIGTANTAEHIAANQTKLATQGFSPVTDQQYEAMSPLEQKAYSSRQSNKYLNEQYAQQSPNAPVAGLMPSMGQVTSEVKDYWKDPAAYTESMGGPSISNMGGYMGGGKSLGQNLSQGNYGQALGQTLGVVPDYAINSLISAGVDTGSGVSNLARGNAGTGIQDVGLGAAKTLGNIYTAGGSLALKAAPAVGKYGAPLLLNTGKALSPLIKTAPTVSKAMKAVKRVAAPIYNYGFPATELGSSLMKSGWEMPGIVKDVGTIIKHIPEFVRGESPWQTNAPWTGRSGNQIAPAPAPPVAAPAPVVPAAPPPPAVVPAPAVDDTEEDPISAGITRGVKGLAGGINKSLDTYNYWMGPKEPPPPVEMPPYKPMVRTNLEYLQGANDSNQAWAHPMMGNENQISYGHMGDTIKSTIGTLFPSFKIGKPDMEAFTKSLTYTPGYKLDTSKL
jgi:hypothetical protein